MKILERAIMPNGTEIQLEADLYGLTIGAYPIAKNYGGFEHETVHLKQTNPKNRITF